MRFRNILFLPLLAIVLVLTAGQLWAAPVITILDVKTTSRNGIFDRDFRIGEVVKYKIGYSFSQGSSALRTVTGKVKVEFADGCVRRYKKVVIDVNKDEGHWMVLRERIPRCSSVANWVTVTYSIKVSHPEEPAKASETGAIFVYPPEEPIARFTATPIYGEAPLTVYFTNKSLGTNKYLGTVDTFDWDFGDGETSHQRNPSHVYDEAGQYSVSLTINDPDGDTKTKTNYITVVDPALVLDANFWAPRDERSVVWVPDDPATLEIYENEVTVNFEDRSIGDHDRWRWDVDNDGIWDYVNVQDPIHVYTEPGLYTVVLKVWKAPYDPLLEDQKTKLNYIYIYEEE